VTMSSSRSTISICTQVYKSILSTSKKTLSRCTFPY